MKPEIKEIESVSGGNIATEVTVKFSELVDLTDATVKLNGKKYDSPSLEADKVTLKLTGLDLDTSKEHTLEIVNLKDLAKEANVNSYIKETFKIEVDKNTPKVTAVTTKSDTHLVFEFSKPVNKPAKDSVKIVDEDLTDITSDVFGASGDFVVVPDTKDTKYTLKIDNANTLLTTKKSRELTVQFVDKKIEDKQGNKLSKTTKTVKLTKDEVKPAVENVTYRTNNDGEVKELIFTFNKDVALTGTPSALTDILADESINEANHVAGDLKAVFGSTLPTITYDVEDNVIKAKFDTALELSGKYTLRVAESKVTDVSLSKNENAEYTFTLDFGEAKEETFKVSTAAAASNVITVKFEEAVKGGDVDGSATRLNAYKLNGKALPEGTVITLNAAQDEAKITLPKGTIEDSDTAAIFIADNIVSKDGKKTLEKYTGTVDIKDNVKPELVSAKLTADNNLLVEFSEEVTPNIADFEIKINDTVVNVTTPEIKIVAGSGSDVGKYVINLADLIIESSETGSEKTVVKLADDNEIHIADAKVKDTFKYATSDKIDSIVIKVVDEKTVDEASNPIVKDTEIKVK